LTGQNFTPTVITYSISGNAGIADVVVSAGGQSATSDSGGNYTISGLVKGVYSLTASKTGYSFTPTTSYVSVGPSAIGINFIPLFSITGNVGIDGANVDIGGNTVISGAGGDYFISGLTAGSYVITPTKYSYDFSPTAKTVVVGPTNSSGNNFIATALPTYSITGNVGVAGASVTVGIKSAISDATGNYVLAGLLVGSYTVTVSKPEYTFLPVNQTVALGSDVSGISFAASVIIYSISGNTELSDVVVSAGGLTTTSDAVGNYTLSSLIAGTYPVTAAKSGFNFTPTSISVTVSPLSAVDINFSPVKYSVSGNVGGAGITVAAGGASTVSDSSGNYLINNLLPGSYDVVVSSPNCVFENDTLPVTIVDSNISGHNFVSTCPIFEPVSKVTLSGDVLLHMEKVDGGASGYQIVYEVDVSKINEVPANTDDPYWWKYYRSFWDNTGKFIGQGATSQIALGGTWNKGPTVDSNFPTEWVNGGWNTVDNTGAPVSDLYSFPYATFFSTRDPYYLTNKFTGILQTVYFQHHIRRKLDDQFTGWSPAYSSLGPNYFIWGEPLSGITYNFKIQLYNKVVYRPEDTNYYGVEGWDYVMAGEVKPSGWAIVPMEPIIRGSTSQQLQWVIIKPKGQKLNVRQSASQCPIPGVVGEIPVEGMTPCVIDPDLWLEVDESVEVTAGGRCIDKNGYEVKYIPQEACGRIVVNLGPGVYASPDELMFIAAQYQLGLGFKDVTVADDHPEEGHYFVIKPDGMVTNLADNATAAILYALNSGTVFVNGSGNEKDSALNVAAELSKTLNKPLVMIYLAQNIYNYEADNDNEIKVRESLTKLIDGTSSRSISLICHSWAGHICMNKARDHSNVTVDLINPAHLPRGYVKDQFNLDIQFSLAKVNIIAGEIDSVSKWGRGQYDPDLFCGGTLCNVKLKLAVEANVLSKQIIIPGADHPMSDMIRHGAASFIQ